MSEERWLITGALGCIGAWCCRQLVREGHSVVAFDLSEDRRRLELIMAPDEVDSVNLVHGDITDLDALEKTLTNRRITNVIHLAAMLVPLAAADPPRGALVNVVGTVNVFEAVKRAGLPGLAYASSAAVYDRSDGIRVAVFHTKVHDRLLRPLLAADQPPAPLPVRQALRTLDHAVDSYVNNARMAA